MHRSSAGSIFGHFGIVEQDSFNDVMRSRWAIRPVRAQRQNVNLSRSRVKQLQALYGHCVRWVNNRRGLVYLAAIFAQFQRSRSRVA